MKRIRKFLNSSLVILLALGLGGCAVGSSTTTSHKTHEASSSQVVKPSTRRVKSQHQPVLKLQLLLTTQQVQTLHLQVVAQVLLRT